MKRFVSSSFIEILRVKYKYFKVFFLLFPLIESLFPRARFCRQIYQKMTLQLSIITRIGFRGGVFSKATVCAADSVEEWADETPKIKLISCI